MTRSQEPDGLRLCRLSKSPTHEGYGFGLREDSARKGYVVDHVDPDSPAQHGGLRQRDKIVEVRACANEQPAEVNGIPVQGRTLKEIIDLIKKNPLKVDLLVSSREAEDASAGSKQQKSQVANESYMKMQPLRIDAVSYGRLPAAVSPDSSEPVHAIPGIRVLALPYSGFMPTPFYGYGYPQWGMPYASYQGYAGYEQPGNGGSKRNEGATRPLTGLPRRKKDDGMVRGGLRTSAPRSPRTVHEIAHR
ncbi:hypothetical protein HPB48_018456 [Haemaphysalis longicornis]|uniref:PDZ domain-containing protein n=1 Tax=Haemaphysalis longicornis TaxID=44386 RepID=A0A9J6FUL3_HAELO|nr:hypothetical protein HPB48_018456 [Haemaphysalis longicornis]